MALATGCGGGKQSEFAPWHVDGLMLPARVEGPGVFPDADAALVVGPDRAQLFQAAWQAVTWNERKKAGFDWLASTTRELDALTGSGKG